MQHRATPPGNIFVVLLLVWEDRTVANLPQARLRLVLKQGEAMRASSILSGAILVLITTHAHAIYKCQQGGAVSFQEVPCNGGQGQQIKVRSTAAPVPPQVASDLPQSADQKVLKGMERDRRIRELTLDISSMESRIANRSDQMVREMEHLRNQKSRASDNLAGATWEQSLSTEMQAVSSKYKAMNDVDIERLRALRQALSSLQGAVRINSDNSSFQN